MSGWIPVDSNLPLQKVRVLTFDASMGDYDVAYLQTVKGEHYWLSKNGAWRILVTHWQPLPNPPKIEQTKEK